MGKIIGIDLGTTNSCVSVFEGNEPVVIANSEGKRTTPSIVAFIDGGERKVGDPAKRQAITNPQRTVFSIKRFMGENWDQVQKETARVPYKVVKGDNNTPRVDIDGRLYTPQEISAMILQKMKKTAEDYLGQEVTEAVITVPAYFSDSQRQATKEAGQIAGLEVKRIVNEPTAAALAYGLDKAHKDMKIAVFDLGGGTFDISVLRITGGIFEVLSTNGDTYLGGDDFDREIVKHWMNEWSLTDEELSVNKNLVQELRLVAENAKRSLSKSDTFSGVVAGTEVSLSRKQFDSLITQFVDKTLQCCYHALSDAALSVSDIDEIIMVGGSTRVPFVKKSVSNFFKQNVNDTLNPDEVVALGAAIQADILAGNNKDMLLLDITPLSLGIETMGGLMDVLIPRNSKIPAKAGRQYTTQKDGQDSMRISVFQGERDMVKDNRKLAEFNLTGIPGMPAGLPKVEVSFLINADGILVVTAKELRSGVSQSVEVKPQYGLTDTEVEKMLMDSLSHAKDDMKTRALVEAQTEAEQLLNTTEQFLVKNSKFLSEKEHSDTIEAIGSLRQKIIVGTKDEIQGAIERLNEISRPYAERLMDEAIGIAMKGRVI